MTEKRLEKNLRDRVKQLRGVALKVWPMSFSGLPDRLVLMPGGRVYFAEIKSPGKKPTARQKNAHAMLFRLGFSVAVIDSAESLNAFLEAIQA